ncbi:MAG: hypothetical protein VKK42_16355 [Lyngbya sp.]|nr:hypothetical protein [Lyngbya sp.]
MSVPISFYIPEDDWPQTIPDCVDTNWQIFLRGPYNWTLQTYVRLRSEDFPCQLIKTLPDEGIVLTHREYLPDRLKPKPKQLLVCLQADQMPHPYAQLHVVQNRLQVMNESKLLGESSYIPHWPQPGLIPRDPSRGDRFENLAYFGVEKQLVPELRHPSWEKQLQELGLSNYKVSTDLSAQGYRWNDYSEVDAVLAIRSFSRQQYIRKPATKLYGAWHAGVPAILGYESAYQAERKSELDYIEVTSVAEVLAALKRLRDDKTFRQAVVENCRVRAQETTPPALIERWRDFINNKAIPAYEQWCSTSPQAQEAFFRAHYIDYLTTKAERVTQEVKRKGTRLLNKLGK